MEIIVSKEDFVKGTNTVNKAVPNRTTLPILESILFEVSAETIKLMANDTEIAIETKVSGEIREPGLVAIDSKVLSDLTKKLPEDNVQIKTDDKTAHIKCGKLKIDIPYRDGIDFPAIPAVTRDKELVISQFSLREIIRQTIFCTSPNDANKMMSGELFEVSGNNLKVVALDGHRIAIRQIELKNAYEDKKTILPAKALNELSRVLSGGVNDEIRIFFTPNHAIFEFDDTVMVSRVIEGDFFNVDQFNKFEATTMATANKKDFLESIDRSTLLLSPTDKKPIIFDVQEYKLEWSVKTSMGAMTEDIDITRQGEDLKIGFNPTFMIEAVRAIDDENITLHFINGKSPCSIKDNDGKYSYIILPVNC